jgi:hypothetical protein
MVANPLKGEVSLSVETGSGTTTYVLKLSINAAVALQKKTGKTLAQLLQSVEALDIDVIRDFAFALLQKHHAKDFKTPESVGDLIDDVGGIVPFLTAFEQLVQANAPAEGSANPPAAPAVAETTGGASS